MVCRDHEHTYDFTGMLDQHRQKLERLFLKSNPVAPIRQFTRREIKLERSDTHDVRSCHIEHRKSWGALTILSDVKAFRITVHRRFTANSPPVH
jgi:hypothetical protein